MSEECPNIANHTTMPTPRSRLPLSPHAVINKWQRWAFNKYRRHTQSQCPDCGKWVIWTRRAKHEADWGGELVIKKRVARIG